MKTGKNTVAARSQRRPYQVGVEVLDNQVHQLVAMAGGSPDARLIEEIMITALKLREDQLDRGDLKLINASLKELRYAFKVFSPYRHVRKVAIFGSARTPKSSPAYRQAKEFSRRIVHAGWMVITGASTGIMSAGNEGAGRPYSFGVNIRLPFEQMANPVIANDPKLINFKYFFTRKLIFIRESDATVLFPGGFGTHDEFFETLTLVQTGKTPPRPIVCIDPPGSHYWREWRRFIKSQMVKSKMVDPVDLDIIFFTQDPVAACQFITHFYHNYHSSRYIGEKLVLRIKRPLSAELLESLNHQFQDIIKRGKIQQRLKPFEEEKNEPYLQDLVRLSFYHNRKYFSRLLRLIEAINKA